ncbi:hypothetical protein HK096_008660, partial [Nowakowskiella sp. JEL0078]
MQDFIDTLHSQLSKTQSDLYLKKYTEIPFNIPNLEDVESLTGSREEFEVCKKTNARKNVLNFQNGNESEPANAFVASGLPIAVNSKEGLKKVQSDPHDNILARKVFMKLKKNVDNQKQQYQKFDISEVNKTPDVSVDNNANMRSSTIEKTNFERHSARKVSMKNKSNADSQFYTPNSNNSSDQDNMDFNKDKILTRKDFINHKKNSQKSQESLFSFSNSRYPTVLHTHEKEEKSDVDMNSNSDCAPSIIKVDFNAISKDKIILGAFDSNPFSANVNIISSGGYDRRKSSTIRRISTRSIEYLSSKDMVETPQQSNTHISHQISRLSQINKSSFLKSQKNNIPNYAKIRISSRLKTHNSSSTSGFLMPSQTTSQDIFAKNMLVIQNMPDRAGDSSFVAVNSESESESELKFRGKFEQQMKALSDWFIDILQLQAFDENGKYMKFFNLEEEKQNFVQ